MPRLLALIFVIFFAFESCKTSKKLSNNTIAKDCHFEKIKFDLTKIDENGKIGPEDGKVLVNYEYCIPNEKDKLDMVVSIDKTTRSTDSKGRSKCGKGFILILGSTSNKDYKEVLCNLSKLEFVTEIKQTFWE